MKQVSLVCTIICFCNSIIAQWGDGRVLRDTILEREFSDHGISGYNYFNKVILAEDSLHRDSIFYSNNVLVRKSVYDKRDGENWDYYYADSMRFVIGKIYGEVKCIGIQNNNQLPGILYGFWGGQLYQIAQGNDSISNGKVIGYWLDTGIKQYEYQCRNNMYVGPYKEYHLNGQLHKDCNYNDYGWMEGTQKFYNDDGSMYALVQYVNGNLHGWYMEFDEDGNCTKRELYLNNKLVE